ncbi:hypothetical protein SAMN07250955_103161 [Arboricoccus pini]|uniref:Cytokinin riboside 5'-monophosphate phosphoribohydrolase n=1 Tax=Arboricoccus pini TaxID=1963835 RepID=A0A212QT54_9PROT|nr:TIGR00730 family Rossman fold protein [Arboricoccus pini]SNB62655.1 hypothetical protein SAMN07250955_103161 [Arboricoccus pini]
MTLEAGALANRAASEHRFSVGVFCGSRFGNDPAYENVARELGRAIATHGWGLVYGGGNVGLMGVVAEAALRAGGHVTGIIPRRLLEREVGKPEIDSLIVTDTMFERKQKMIAAADAFVTIAGGFGTLDELLEVITLKQLGYHEGAIMILDTLGIWQSLLQTFDDLIGRNFAAPDAVSLWQVASDVESCVALLRQGASGQPAAPAP